MLDNYLLLLIKLGVMSGLYKVASGLRVRDGEEDFPSAVIAQSVLDPCDSVPKAFFFFCVGGGYYGQIPRSTQAPFFFSPLPNKTPVYYY